MSNLSNIVFPISLIPKTTQSKKSDIIDSAKGSYSVFTAITFCVEGSIQAGEEILIQYADSNKKNWITLQRLTLANPAYTAFGPVVVRIFKPVTVNKVGVSIKYG